MDKHNVMSWIAQVGKTSYLGGRQVTVELLYSYIGTTRLVLNAQISAVIEVDTSRIEEIEQQLQAIASMPLTTTSTIQITKLARKLELMKTPLRSETNGLRELNRMVALNVAWLLRAILPSLNGSQRWSDFCR